MDREEVKEGGSELQIERKLRRNRKEAMEGGSEGARGMKQLRLKVKEGGIEEGRK